MKSKKKLSQIHLYKVIGGQLFDSTIGGRSVYREYLRYLNKFILQQEPFLTNNNEAINLLYCVY